jgi:membrane protease subunit (stomatin/prohibitin family)
MFCSACGKQVADQATFCPGCGAPVSQPAAGQAAPAQAARKFCPNCGTALDPLAAVCVKCGSGVPHKDFLTTLLLCIFLGVFGVHRFYTGNVGIGVAQLLTLGGCGIWVLVDIILIAAGSYRDGNGNPLVGR